MDVQQKSAETIVRWFSEREEIKKVYYPMFSTHPGRDIHVKQASGGGAVVSFELENGEIAKEVLRRVKLPLMAVSLGGVESILSYPATMSHASMPREERYARGITDGLLRLSVGLEDPKDLCDDIETALKSAR